MDKMNDATIKIKNINDPIKNGRLTAKTGDTRGRDLHLQLVDEQGDGLNTEGVRLTLAYKTPSRVINEIPFTPVDESSGLYTLTYDAGLTHEAGVVTATIRLKTYDTTTETPNFEIYVEGSPLEGIHFSEVDGMTFKKVMDKVDAIDLRASLIEQDILHIDDQLQDMNTRIVYVEEEDRLEERVYNNENDIVLLQQEINRVDGELEELKTEIENIEVGEGSGGGGSTPTEQDTGWRVLSEYGRVGNTGMVYNIYARRVGNIVEILGYLTNKNGDNDYSSNLNKQPLSGLYGFPDTFYPTGLGRNITKEIKSSFHEIEEGYWLEGGSFIRVKDSTNNPRYERYTLYMNIKKGHEGSVEFKYPTTRPFTDEYMDLPLADFN